MPPPAAYFEPINWHRTALHELGHATGHALETRPRPRRGTFGTKKYAFEELVAEMNAPPSAAPRSASCRRCAMPTTSASWLEVLREDNRAIVRAASAGQQGRRLAARFPPRSRRRDPRRTNHDRQQEGGMILLTESCASACSALSAARRHRPGS